MFAGNNSNVSTYIKFNFVGYEYEVLEIGHHFLPDSEDLKVKSVLIPCSSFLKIICSSGVKIKLDKMVSYYEE